MKNEPEMPSLTSASFLSRSVMTGSFLKAVMVGMEEGQLAGEGPEWRGSGGVATSWHTPASLDDGTPCRDSKISTKNSCNKLYHRKV